MREKEENSPLMRWVIMHYGPGRGLVAGCEAPIAHDAVKDMVLSKSFLQRWAF